MRPPARRQGTRECPWWNGFSHHDFSLLVWRGGIPADALRQFCWPVWCWCWPRFAAWLEERSSFSSSPGYCCRMSANSPRTRPVLWVRWDEYLAPIRAGGTGEIVYEQLGALRSAPARSEDGEPIQKQEEVFVVRYEKGIAYVRRVGRAGAAGRIVVRQGSAVLKTAGMRSTKDGDLAQISKHSSRLKGPGVSMTIRPC